MVYLFLANGFEEVEALATLDVLRRAEINVLTVGVGSEIINGSHNIPVIPDKLCSEIVLNDKVDAIILPGGMPGTLNLEKDETVNSAIDFAIDNEKLICAICAAPSILGHKGLLEGKKATCFPGFESELFGAETSDEFVIKDGNIITSKGMGCAIEFGLKIVEALQGANSAKKLRNTLQIYNG